MKNRAANKIIEKYVLLLSSSEVGLGSFLHGFHIPLGGHFLSINQSLILTLLARESKDRLPASTNAFYVSHWSAAIKLLSPMGKKITPMLAIGIQGTLYALSLFLLGVNWAGLVCGSSLVALWGMVQSITFAVLFFGKPLLDSVFHFNETITQELGLPSSSLLWVCVVFVAVKAFIAVVLNLFVWRNARLFEELYFPRLQGFAQRFFRRRDAPSRNILFLSFLDLFSPWFLFSLSLTAAFLVFVQEMDWASVLTYLVRPWVLAWLSFLFVRLLLERVPYLKQLGGDADGNLAGITGTNR